MTLPSSCAAASAPLAQEVEIGESFFLGNQCDGDGFFSARLLLDCLRQFPWFRKGWRVRRHSGKGSMGSASLAADVEATRGRSNVSWSGGSNMSQKLLKHNRKNRQDTQCQQVEFVTTPMRLRIRGSHVSGTAPGTHPARCHVPKMLTPPMTTAVITPSSTRGIEYAPWRYYDAP